EAWLHYRVNATEDSVTMSGPGGTGGLYTGIIPIGVATVGQTVSYWVSANDNEGNRGESIIKPSFGIIAPINPDADILLVDDNVRFHFRGMMQRVLDNLGYTYEFWSITGHNGIDASVTTYGWSAAIITGWIASSVPTRGYDGTPWAAFLDGGGHLFYADQDYFYANEGTNPTPSFGPGDFAYDYFGLASGENDQYHDVYYTFFGVAGDTVSGDFTSGVEISLPTNWNWTDITVPAATAVEIFTTQDGKGAGVRYDGGTFKTVYLPWMYEALPCEAERSTLTKNVMDWFGVSAAPGPLVCSATADPMSLAPGDTVTITAHVTDDNGAFSVTAEIESPDETVMTILTLFDDGQHHDGASGDGTYGNTWTTINERVYLVDIVAVDNELNSVTYNNMAHFVATTSTLPFWGDLHGHTGFSDGIGTPEEYYLYARDVSDLDFVAIHPVNYSYLNFPTSLCSIAPNAEVPGKQYEESIQYALAQGFKIGMLNVSDTHNGTPSTGGLTAVYASGLTRGGILNGLRARHNYATTGARILLDFKIDGHTMGQAYSTDIYPEIDVNVIGTTMIQKIEVVKNNYVLYAHYGSDIAESFSYVDQ
ncbi:MAG: choice-of-anchor X domain-containing protein, partial [bacterium]